MLSVHSKSLERCLTWLAEACHECPARVTKIQSTIKGFPKNSEEFCTADQLKLVTPCIDDAIWLISHCQDKEGILVFRASIGDIVPTKRAASLVLGEAVDFLRTIGRAAAFVDSAVSKKHKWSNVQNVAKALLAPVVSESSESIVNRVVAVMSLFNSIPSDYSSGQGNAKSAVWLKLVNTACTHEKGEFIYREYLRPKIAPELLLTELKQWKLEESDLERVCTKTCELLLQFNDVEWAYEYALVSAKSEKANENSATSLLESALRDESIIFYDHLKDLPCVVSIIKQNHPVSQVMVALLNQDVEELKRVWKTHKETFVKFQIFDKNLINQLRIAQIISSGFGSSGDCLSNVTKISDLTKLLKCENDQETENLIARAITKGQLIGRIRQASNDVVISNTQPFEFSIDGYKVIQTRLASLLKTVESLEASF